MYTTLQTIHMFTKPYNFFLQHLTKLHKLTETIHNSKQFYTILQTTYKSVLQQIISYIHKSTQVCTISEIFTKLYTSFTKQYTSFTIFHNTSTQLLQKKTTQLFITFYKTKHYTSLPKLCKTLQNFCKRSQNFTRLYKHFTQHYKTNTIQNYTTLYQSLQTYKIRQHSTQLLHISTKLYNTFYTSKHNTRLHTTLQNCLNNSSKPFYKSLFTNLQNLYKTLYN